MENDSSIIVNTGNDSIATLSTSSLRNSASIIIGPWLLPVMVAVIMMMFLVISFALYHKRYLLKRKKSLQYHLIHYHRVAGPRTPPEIAPFINLLPGTSNAGIKDAPDAIEPEPNKRVDSRVKHGDTLRRCYSLSPRHLKDRALRSEGRRLDVSLSPNKRGLLRDAQGVHLMTACEIGGQCNHPDHVSFLQATTVQSLAKLKSRAVVVTTVNGVLARARFANQGESESEDSGNVLESRCDEDESCGQDFSDIGFIDDIDYDEFTGGKII